MANDFAERDWKVFSELRKVALERLCAQILEEIKAAADAPEKSFHERYLDVFKLIQKRDRDVADGFNDFRRSTALQMVGVINSMGLITSEELQRFSPEARAKISVWIGQDLG